MNLPDQARWGITPPGEVPRFVSGATVIDGRTISALRPTCAHRILHWLRLRSASAGLRLAEGVYIGSYIQRRRVEVIVLVCKVTAGQSSVTSTSDAHATLIPPLAARTMAHLHQMTSC